MPRRIPHIIHLTRLARPIRVHRRHRPSDALHVWFHIQSVASRSWLYHQQQHRADEPLSAVFHHPARRYTNNRRWRNLAKGHRRRPRRQLLLRTLIRLRVKDRPRCLRKRVLYEWEVGLGGLYRLTLT
jgi:hypothetical protein